MQLQGVVVDASIGRVGQSSVIVTRLHLSDVRGFSDLDIDFGDKGASALITGDNGDGKSTVLRALAMGLCDQLGASGLLSELPGDFIRYGRKKALISIELLATGGSRYKIDTEVDELGKMERIRQKTFSKPSKKRSGDWILVTGDNLFPWSELFGAGYGAGLRLLGTERYQHYYLTDAVYSLFKSDTKLQEQELAFRRLLDQARKISKTSSRKAQKEITNRLLQVLNLPETQAIELRENGIFFGPEESRTELTAMGDGVRAIVTLVLDLMSWWYLHLNDADKLASSKACDTTQIHGTVIVDEIEKHLHPSWQRNIIATLLEAFPKVQFVMSTHAPLCVSGSTDFGRDKIFLYRTRKEEDGSISGFPYDLPKGYRADQVLTSEAFGLTTSVSPDTERLVQSIRTLFQLEKRTSDQEQEYRRLLRELEALSQNTAESEADWRMRVELINLLRAQSDNSG